MTQSVTQRNEVRPLCSGHPIAADVQLAIEVAHSSLAYDLEDKRRLYAQAGIVEYWVIVALASCIHLFWRPERGKYSIRKVFKVGEKFAPQIAPKAQLDLSAMFADM